jgi:hypothetical protein
MRTSIRDERGAYFDEEAFAVLAASLSIRTPRSLTNVLCDLHDFLHPLHSQYHSAVPERFLPIERGRLAHNRALLECRSRIASLVVSRCLTFNRNHEKPSILRVELDSIFCHHLAFDLAHKEAVENVYLR